MLKGAAVGGAAEEGGGLIRRGHAVAAVLLLDVAQRGVHGAVVLGAHAEDGR